MMKRVFVDILRNKVYVIDYVDTNINEQLKNIGEYKK